MYIHSFLLLLLLFFPSKPSSYCFGPTTLDVDVECIQPPPRQPPPTTTGEAPACTLVWTTQRGRRRTTAAASNHLHHNSAADIVESYRTNRPTDWCTDTHIPTAYIFLPHSIPLGGLSMSSLLVPPKQLQLYPKYIYIYVRTFIHTYISSPLLSRMMSRLLSYEPGQSVPRPPAMVVAWSQLCSQGKDI